MRARPTLLVLAALLVAGHLGWNVQRAVAMRAMLAPPGSLMPAAGGALETLEIQFHRTGAERFLEVYAQLLPALDPSTEVIVTVSDTEDRARFENAARRWFAGRPRPEIEYVLTGRPITSWARDRLAVLAPGENPRTTLLAPPAPMTGPRERVHDWLVPWALGEARPERLRVKTANFHFEGGDLIADETHVFVATPLFERNPDLSPEALLARVEAATGLAAVRVDAPGAPSPDHHIGIFLTPLGGGKVAYADPDLGLALLRSTGALRPDRTITIGNTRLTLDEDPARLARFRTVARRLREAGFEAIALPVLPTTSAYVVASWNNVLMERRRDGRLHVYLPTFGIVPLDRQATTTFEAQGAVVHPIRVERLFRLGGSVRCLTAPLARRLSSAR